MREQLLAAQREVEKTKMILDAALSDFDKAVRKQSLLKRAFERQSELNIINQELAELDGIIMPEVPGAGRFRQTVNALPKLVLPKLLDDHTDVDPSCRLHLDPQAQQIIGVFKALSSPQNPYVSSNKIKKYILAHFEIEHHDYWMARTSPREPERWWKNIYDKAIERLDLVLNLVFRSDKTGKKGSYALREYLNADNGRLLFRENGK